MAIGGRRLFDHRCGLLMLRSRGASAPAQPFCFEDIGYGGTIGIKTPVSTFQLKGISLPEANVRFPEEYCGEVSSDGYPSRTGRKWKR